MAVDAKGLKATGSALKPRAFGEFLWLQVLIYNLANGPVHNLVHNLVRNLAYNPAKSGYNHVAVTV